MKPMKIIPMPGMLQTIVPFKPKYPALNKINKRIEVLIVAKPRDPKANQKNVAIVWDENNILAILSTAYSHVIITEIKTENDLKQLAIRKPDLVFSGVKYFDFNQRTIWLNDYLEIHGIAYMASGRQALQNEHDKSRAKEIMQQAKVNTADFFTTEPGELQGINNFAQLAAAERYWQRRRAHQLMLAGVHLPDPERIDIRGELITGRNVHIDVNCIFEGRVVLGDNVRIGPNCVIRDAELANDVQIKAFTMLEGARIGTQGQVGPYARLRPGTQLLSDARVGNFVEIKNTILGQGSKASHLSYLGDAIIGQGVNIGAGTITCNYDGVNKHQTVIEDLVFVGSNTALVAPITIGAGATLAAGSTITRDVKQGQLAVARGRQSAIDNWQGPRDK